MARLALCACVSAALVSCERAKPSGKAGTPFAIDRSYERGPLTLRLKVDKKELTIADTLRLVIEAEVKEDYEVELPKFGEKLEQFGILDYRTAPPELLAEGRIRVKKSYELEPLLSGEYKIPPMKIRFWEKKAESRARPKKHELETEEVAITVKSLLGEKRAQLKIRDIAGPVELARSPLSWTVLTTAAAGLVLVAAAVAMWRRRRRREAAAPRVPAHEMAWRLLEALLAEQLVEKGQTKRFYIGLSDILRHYIENRFGLHAPERTTEEFLDELRTSAVLNAGHKALLEEFLRHCDLVKFAEYQPMNDEIQRTFDACKNFVESTRAAESSAEVQANAA